MMDPAETDPLDPIADEETPGRRRLLRRRILRDTPALPVLVTLLNGIAGFASIYYATRSGIRHADLPDMTIAAWLIFAAMGFDALDGRLARMARRATDFGAQLDSLCDVVSFGVAPGILMVHAVSVTKEIEDFDIFLPQAPILGKAVMAIAVVYVCCAVLRLARFNIENAPDLLGHLYFRGLPSPGAAAAVASVVLLFRRLQQFHSGPMSARWLNVTVGAALPAVTFAVALLMISRLRYPHLINQFIVGRRTFGYIVRAVLAIVLALVFLQMAMAVIALAYVGAGPVKALVRRVRLRRQEPPPG